MLAPRAVRCGWRDRCRTFCALESVTSGRPEERWRSLLGSEYYSSCDGGFYEHRHHRSREYRRYAYAPAERAGPQGICCQLPRAGVAGRARSRERGAGRVRTAGRPFRRNCGGDHPRRQDSGAAERFVRRRTGFGCGHRYRQLLSEARRPNRGNRERNSRKPVGGAAVAPPGDQGVQQHLRQGSDGARAARRNTRAAGFAGGRRRTACQAEGAGTGRPARVRRRGRGRPG